MSWQSVRHPIHDEADGSHYYMRAEEWPFAGNKPVRFMIDVDYPPDPCLPVMLAKFLLTASRDTKVVLAVQKIDYDAENAIIERYDWSADPRDFAKLASLEAADAVYRYVFGGKGPNDQN